MSKALNRVLMLSALCGFIGLVWDFPLGTIANIGLLLVAGVMWYKNDPAQTPASR